MIKDLYQSLCAAFGGASQVSDRIVGRAIFGQFNNNGGAIDRTNPATAIAEAVAIIADRWPPEECGREPSEIRAEIYAGILDEFNDRGAPIYDYNNYVRRLLALAQ